jgi:hypothetical protein
VAKLGVRNGSLPNLRQVYRERLSHLWRYATEVVRRGWTRTSVACEENSGPTPANTSNRSSASDTVSALRQGPWAVRRPGRPVSLPPRPKQDNGQIPHNVPCGPPTIFGRTGPASVALSPLPGASAQRLPSTAISWGNFRCVGVGRCVDFCGRVPSHAPQSRQAQA